MKLTYEQFAARLNRLEREEPEFWQYLYALLHTRNASDALSAPRIGKQQEPTLCDDDQDLRLWP